MFNCMHKKEIIIAPDSIVKKTRTFQQIFQVLCQHESVLTGLGHRF